LQLTRGVPGLNLSRMKIRFRRYLLPALLSTALAGAPACERQSTDRWVATSNTNADIDWDAVAKAYKEAEGPQDFEKKVNEIYTGDELISISVVDKDDKHQVVTGFIDNNVNGAVDEGEKIFEITRRITGEDAGEYRMSGYGHYAGYHSPVFGIMTGMMLGSMLMGPTRGAYTTTPARREALAQHRSSYRAANPGRFSRARASQTGRSYGSQGRDFNRTRSSAPRRSGGGMRFGAKGTSTPVRRLEV